MLFNTLDFAIFLPIVFVLYWFVTHKNLRFQNILLLVASYYFYACWDYRFLFLLIFSTFLDYFTGIKIHEKETRNRKLFWLWLSISVNLGFLGIFKYYNFFATSFAEAFSFFGMKIRLGMLDIILPVGISFYTFHGLSYVLDIYNGKIKPVKNFIEYSVFVSFFPLLVAGPIERATHLLPQIQRKRNFDYFRAVDGLRQILWGLFKKIVIADTASVYVTKVFENSDTLPGSSLLIGIILFAFQIYCDFSGYSDIALGTARLLGIELLRNFAFPYFSRDIAEFWRRWHISLSSWFRDYLYIPLGGSKGGIWFKIRNILIIFLVSGFWHGANWTFIIWGGLNALYFLPLMIFNKNRVNIQIASQGKLVPTLKEFAQISITFFLTLIAWVFFRAENVLHAISYLQNMFSTSLFSFFSGFYAITKNVENLIFIFLFIFVLLIVEWFQREKEHGLQINENNNSNLMKFLRGCAYIIISITIILNISNEAVNFIYFQF